MFGRSDIAWAAAAAAGDVGNVKTADVAAADVAVAALAVPPFLA